MLTDPTITDPEAEAATLGACLLTGRHVEPLTSETGLLPEHFYLPAHRAVWEALVGLTDEGVGIDVLTVATRAATLSDQAPADDWPGFVDRLTGVVPVAGHASSYGRRVIECWRWEQSRRAHIEALAAVGERDPGALLAAEEAATRLVADGTTDHLTDAARAAEHMAGWLMAEPEPALPLPWPRLARTLRLRAGHVTVLSGWSSMGKSHAADVLGAHVGQRGHRVVVWDNEMTREERWARYITRETGVPLEAIMDRDMNAQQAGRVRDALRGIPFGVVDASGWDAVQIARHIRQVKPALAIVDHFHAMPAVSRTDEADAAVQALVAAAGISGCHMILICQLSQGRNVGTVRPPPVGRDLRGTGNLYNLPSNVLLVHRHEEEARDEDGDLVGRSVQLPAGHLDVAKQRNGPRVTIPAHFDEHRLRWLEEEHG